MVSFGALLPLSVAESTKADLFSTSEGDRLVRRGASGNFLGELKGVGHSGVLAQFSVLNGEVGHNHGVGYFTNVCSNQNKMEFERIVRIRRKP